MGVTALLNQVLARPGDTAHLVHLYRDPAALAATVSLYLDDGLKRGEAAVVIARTEHCGLIRRGLEELRWTPDRLEEEGRLGFLEAHRTLAAFMRDGMPDPMLFRKTIGPTLSALASASTSLGSSRGHAGIRAYGEMVSLLWRDGRQDAAVRLEKLWNQLGESHDFTLFCAYEGDGLSAEFHGRAAESVYREHSHVVPSEDYGRLTRAVDDAMDEVLGAAPSAALRPMIAAGKRRESVLPGAQASLLWIQSHLPGRIDDVLASARRHYELPQGR
jgi:hypothetical protein